MKSKTSVRAQLGATQEEMAMILGIGMSTWSMYESGLRDLPVHASQTLAEMLLHVQKTPAKNGAKKPQQDPLITSEIESMLRENAFQRLRLTRQYAAFTQKQETIDKRARLKDFLDQRTPTGKGIASRLPNNKKYVADNDAARQAFVLERKLALLEFERQWLENRRNTTAVAISNDR